MSDAKPAESRQRRNLPGMLPASVAVEAPDFPDGLAESYRARWDGLWRSPVAALMDPVSDAPTVVRLFELYALADRVADELASAEELDTGLVSARVRLSSEIRLIEGQLGLSPRSRLALGIALLAGKKASLDELVDDADDDE